MYMILSISIIFFSKLVMTMLILYIIIIMREGMVKADMIMAATQMVLVATFFE